MNARMKVSMIGHGGMLQSCVRIAAKNPNVSVERVFVKGSSPNEDHHFFSFLVANNIDCVKYSDFSTVAKTNVLPSTREHMLASIYNEDKLTDDFLGHFDNAVNFHDSPLPRYAGRNAVSWALMHGEREHGVTWHDITTTYDAGAIVRQELFPIDPSWTALDLAVRSVEVGCSLFSGLLENLVRGGLRRKSQDLCNRTYFGKKDLPFSGRFPFLMRFPVLERLRRATGYFPMPNRFCAPIVTLGDTSISLIKFGVDSIPTNEEPGTIICRDNAGATFATFDGTMRAELVAISGGKAIAASDPHLADLLRPYRRASVDSSTYNDIGL